MTATFSLETVKLGESGLQGLWRPLPQARGVAIHVHGTWGNFYGNPFIVPCADLFGQFGFSFLSANFPGHDETSVNEKFGEFGDALDMWLGRLAPHGPVILQGHSLGALKAIDFVRRSTSVNASRIRALSLLSPFDIVAFYAKGKVGAIGSRLETLRKIATANGPKTLVPKDLFDIWDISVETVLELATPGSAADQFPSRDGLKGAWLQRGFLPTFIAIGGADFAAYPTPDAAWQMASSLPNCSAHLIEGAPHNFADHVDELVSRQRAWLQGALGKLG